MNRNAHRQCFKAFFLYWLPVLAWLALIFWSSSRSSVPEPGKTIGLSRDITNYCAHALVFGVLVLLTWRLVAARTLHLPAVATLWSLPSAGIFAALYAVSDEFHQRFVPGRSADVRDWLADVVGILVVLALLVWWRTRKSQTAS
jgi:hypothetical protein